MSRGFVQLAVASAFLIGAAGACTSNRDNRAANNTAGQSTDTTARSATRDTGATAAPGSQPSAATGMTVAQIASNASQYVGQRVSVRGDVGQSVGQDAFTLTDGASSSTMGSAGSAGTSSGTAGTSGTGGSDTAAAGGGTSMSGSSKTSDRLLVLSPSGVASDRHDLTVSGIVRTFTSAADLRADAPWLGASGSTADLDQFRSKPVIVADSIRTADGRELISGSGALPASSGELGSGNGAGSKNGAGGSGTSGTTGTTGTSGMSGSSGTSGTGSSGSSGSGNSGTSGGSGSSGSGGSTGSGSGGSGGSSSGGSGGSGGGLTTITRA